MKFKANTLVDGNSRQSHRALLTKLLMDKENLRTALRISTRILGKAGTDATDAVQSAVAYVLKTPPRDPENINQSRSYFFEVVRTQSLRSVRGSVRLRRIENVYAKSKNTIRDAVTSEAVIQEERKGALREALHALKNLEPAQWDAVFCCVEMGLSQREAAKQLGVCQKTVSGRLNAGLDGLRQDLESKGFPSILPIYALIGVEAISATPGALQGLEELIANVQQQLSIKAPLSSTSTSTTASTASSKASLGVWSTIGITALIAAGVLQYSGFGITSSAPDHEVERTIGAGKSGLDANNESMTLGLMAHYTFDETSENKVVDHSGHGNHGILTRQIVDKKEQNNGGKNGIPKWRPLKLVKNVSNNDQLTKSFNSINTIGLKNSFLWNQQGKIEGALCFVRSGTVRISSTPSLEISDFITLSAFFKIEVQRLNSLPFIMLFNKKPNWLADRGKGYSLVLFPTKGVMRFLGSGNQSIPFEGPATVEINRWHHVAVTLSGDAINMYFDGKLVQKGNVGAVTASKLGLKLGNPEVRGVSMDDMRIYNRTLSASEIQVLAKLN